MAGLEIGLISDTHDLLRPEAVLALRGVDHILHAGDVCSPDVLARLQEIAPVDVVRGNNDRGAWAAALPIQKTVALGGLRIHLRHIAGEVGVDLAAERIDLVVVGHSHRPKTWTERGALWIDPGSAGPRRFRLPVCVARLHVRRDEPGLPPSTSAEIIELDARS